MISKRRIAGLLTAVLLTSWMAAGCGSGYSDEMLEQESVMANETAEWSKELPRWEQDLADQSSWLASHPAPPADAKKAETYRQHEERLSKHQQDVARYRQELEAHMAGLKREDNQPEQVRTESHDAMWTEHQKLKASFTMLENQHEELLKEHSEMLTAGNIEVSKDGERR